MSQERPSEAQATAGRAGAAWPTRRFAHSRERARPALPFEGRLPSFTGVTQWLNAEPLTPAGLRGRVVVVDFWTFTCVNWLRTLPYRRAWAEKYAGAGLTVIGVHTPEFGFEHHIENVVAQSSRLGVTYPVAVDNDFAVWGAFSNHYWPALYVADADGRLRYHHYGEGEYAMAEMVLQQLLVERGAEGVDDDLVEVNPRGLEVPADWGSLRSPETYTGFGQATGFASSSRASYRMPFRYDAAARLSLNQWDLDGTWTVGEHAASLDEPGGRVVFQFHARDVNLVMGPVPGSGPVRFRVRVDGRATERHTGTDVSADGVGEAVDQRCYQLVRQHGPIRERRFEIEFLDPGVEVYCFTFG